MAAVNDFLAWATGGGANVLSQVDYEADAPITNGFSSGLAPSNQCNKTWRQATFPGAVVSQLMADLLADHVADDGVVGNYMVQLWQTLLMCGEFTDVGSANTLLTSNPFGLTFPAPVTGLRVTVKVAATNTSSTVNFNWMGTGNKLVLYGDLVAPAPGDIVANSLLDLEYDGTRWQIVGTPHSANGWRVTTSTATSRTFAAGDQSHLIVRSNAGSNMVDTVPGTGSVLPAGTYGVLNSDSTAVLVIQFPTSGVNWDGTTSGLVYLGPRQQLYFFSDGANYYTVAKPSRCMLAANLTVSVNTSTGSDSNNGITNTFLTIQKAVNFVANSVDIMGFVVTISCNGTFTAQVTIAGPFRGASRAGSVVFQYTTGSSHVVTNGYCYDFSGGAQATIQCSSGTATLSATGGSGAQGFIVRCSGGGTQVTTGTNLVFGSATQFSLYAAAGGRINVTNSFTMSGGGIGFLYAHFGGQITADGVVCTISGTPGFSNAWLVADELSTVEITAFGYTGSATGVRANVIQNSSVYTAGGGAAYFPGSSPSTTASGGQLT